MTGARIDLDADPITPTRPTPIGRTWLRNRWEELAYLHWPYDADLVQSLLPDGLGVDTFDGRAWVSLVPFRMTDAMLRALPAVPGVSRFAETNVRTYVVDSKGHRSVWFFSLEAEALPIVVFARWLLGFPYVWSRMSIEVDGDVRRYTTAERRWPRRPPSRTEVTLEIGDPITDPSDLDVFLSARWGTVARWPRRSRQLWHHPVDHPEWQLHEATLTWLDDASVARSGLPEPAEMPIVRWARSVDARFGRPERI